MTLDATITVRQGTFTLDIGLSAAPGETVALLGPNGAGKSTVLRVLSGLLPLDAGAVRLDEQTLDDPASDVFVVPEQRPVSVVFQDYLLFPTMTVLENVAFGLRARGRRKADARRVAADWLERIGLPDTAARRPTELSGGQQQRIALARALATAPRLLLLDEPLAALDAGTRADVRREIRRHLATFDGIRLLVTHDPVDAYALADRIVVLESGAVVQSGTLADVTAHPRTAYVADLVGLNLVTGAVRGSMFVLPSGEELVVTADAPSGPAFAAVHPRAVALHREQPHGSQRNTWPAVVDDLDQRGDVVRVRTAGRIGLTAEVTASAVASLALRPGDPVWVALKATEIRVYPA